MTFQQNYHLVLIKYYLEDKNYAAFYRKCKLEGDWIILDNSAAEIKSSVGEELLLKVTKELSPDLVIAPDVIYNAPETIRRTKSFIEAYWSELYKCGTGIMVVPQGKDKTEWLKCYEIFNNLTGVQWLGISKFYTPVFGSRLSVLDAIAPTVKRSCHLLGVWDNPYSLLYEKDFSFVRGVDTAKPIEYALKRLTLSQWNEHKHMDDDWYMSWRGEKSKLMKENIDELKELVR